MMRLCAVLVLALCASGCDDPVAPTKLEPLVVLEASGALAPGHELFVNTDRGRTDWLTPTADGLQVAYPSGQAWGFIAAVLVGSTTPGSRPSRDVSGYKTLQLQLRGAVGGESIEIGIKDDTDRDDGTETKKTVVLSTNWQTFTFPLNEFSTADRTRLYLFFELVFNGASARTVSVRDVRYVP